MYVYASLGLCPTSLSTLLHDKKILNNQPTSFEDEIMKENLQVLLDSLQDEKLLLEIEKENLTRQHVALNHSRTRTARNCLARLLPDLEMNNIKALLHHVPDFQVPTASRWFCFGKKVAPGVTLDSLRIKLGAYLDNTQDVVPVIWKDEVLPIDVSIRDLQENLIRSNAERIADIDMRIVALEKLLRVDVEKMDPKVHTCLEQAVASQVKTARESSRPFSNLRSAVPVNTPYPSHTQINSNSGPNLLEMWLWWQILTPHSECSHEVHRLEPDGDGDFGGAGASGSWDERSDTAHPMSTSSPFVSDLLPNAVHAEVVNQTEEAQLAVQAELGSQSFS
jgi:hypothetical protein